MAIPDSPDVGDAGRNAPDASQPTRSFDPVLSLTGRLILYPSPNRPGFWAYRVMLDGTLLEIELNQNEWQSLSQAELAAQNDTVRRLNEHPLNQAALVLLHQAGEGPRNGGSLEWTHILSLASLELPDFDEGAEAQEAGVKFAEWTGSVAAMRTAQATLQASFGPEAILEMSPRGAAEYILAELGIC